MKTPEHDEIMVWLDSNIAPIVNMFFGPQWTKNDIERVRRQLGKPIEGDIPARQKPKIIQRIWEKPVVSEGYKSKYIVGFVDLAVEIKEWYLGLDYWPERWATGNRVSKWETEISYESSWILFEAKASIPSLGELIRQIRMYQEYQPGRYVVVSPDDRFAEAIKAQGIAFVTYLKEPVK